jgi:hypothetical protein
MAVCDMFSGKIEEVSYVYAVRLMICFLHVLQALVGHMKARDLRRNKDMRGFASSLNNIGICYRLQHRYTEAAATIRAGLMIRESLSDVWGIAGSRVQLAAVLAKLQQSEDAHVQLNEARTTFARLNDRLGLAECLEVEALLCGDRKEELLAEARKLRTLINAPLPVAFQREDE